MKEVIFGNVIRDLRKSQQMSQEEFAESLNVSKQAVQKWENGASIPDISHLLLIHEKFGISLDRLFFGASENNVQAIRFLPVNPDYATRSFWDEYSQNLLIDYRQSTEEGKDIAAYKSLIECVDGLPNGNAKHDMSDIIYRLIADAPERDGYLFVEPSDYDGIVALSNAKTDLKPLNVDKNKLEGAFTGRIVGCLLGKPVEGVTREGIRAILRASDNYPIKRYITTNDIIPEVPFSDCYCVDRVEEYPFPDDDIDYTVLAQRVVDKYGADFTAENVIATWCDLVPRNVFCTAERVAFKNYTDGYMPPYTAMHQNAFREWIGAQIRADYYGYICPGDPFAAAAMAFRDASVSHTKNGIYGSMYVAALIAVAARTSNMEEAIGEALQYIPTTSRMYKAINGVLKDYSGGVTEQKCFDKIFAEYDDSDVHCWLHVICNAMIVTAALLYGNKDFTRTLSLAVSAGYDTDCNGATCGSVLGMMCGMECIAPSWTAVLRGGTRTDVRASESVKITEFVQTAVKHANIINKEAKNK